MPENKFSLRGQVFFLKYCLEIDDWLLSEIIANHFWHVLKTFELLLELHLQPRYELPPSLVCFLYQTFQRFRRHASHTELFDQEVDSFSWQRFGEDVSQLVQSLKEKRMYLSADFRSTFFQGRLLYSFWHKTIFFSPCKPSRSETYVSASVKEIDYVQLGIVNQAELKLQPREHQHLKLNYFSLSNLGDFMFKSTEKLKGLVLDLDASVLDLDVCFEDYFLLSPLLAPGFVPWGIYSVCEEGSGALESTGTSKLQMAFICAVKGGKKGFGLLGLSRVTSSSLGVILGDGGFCEDDSAIMELGF
ncbi:hypothetical protein Tco_1046145 [Tanacetum coccineum]